MDTESPEDAEQQPVRLVGAQGSGEPDRQDPARSPAWLFTLPEPEPAEEVLQEEEQETEAGCRTRTRERTYLFQPCGTEQRDCPKDLEEAQEGLSKTTVSLNQTSAGALMHEDQHKFASVLHTEKLPTH